MPDQAQGRSGLEREISSGALLFTGITGIVGSGWLFASLYAAQLAGPAAILSWCIGGAVAVMLALVYAELGGMLPLAGAIARIPYFSHGGMSGFMAGWLCCGTVSTWHSSPPFRWPSFGSRSNRGSPMRRPRR